MAKERPAPQQKTAMPAFRRASRVRVYDIITYAGALERLKVACRVLAERADEVVGQRFALIDVSADGAYPALLLLCLR